MKINKKILFIILLIFIVGVASYLLIFNKKSNSKSSTESIKAPEISLSDDNDWSNYKTYNIELSNEVVNITEEGVYNITGTLNDNNIVINTEGNVKLVLNNVTIKNSNGPAINVENAKNVYIELIGENKIDVNTTEELDAAIYSCDDLFFEGTGSLTITSNMDGIKSKDDLTIYSGIFNIESSDDAIVGKDSVSIINGTFNITSTGDAIKTTNETELGVITIKDGTFNIKSEADGIDSISTIYIDGGKFNITTGSGYNKTTKTFFNTKSSSTESKKGIKADGDIIINGGEFTLNTEDDSIHTNSNMTITSGTFNIKSSDDGIHADGLLEVNGGTFDITASEGVEATYVKINNGTIKIEASDDGINAGNKSNDYDTTIEINGGNITINMGAGDTDAIDSNGNLYINGGTINITGNSPFDYDGEAKYTGGTLIVNGENTTSITNQMMGGPRGQDNKEPSRYMRQ